VTDGKTAQKSRMRELGNALTEKGYIVVVDVVVVVDGVRG
jgi:hypothetical protein